MKILMITNDFLPNPGGVANHILELSRGLVQLGHEVRILHFTYSHVTPVAEEIDGVKIIRHWISADLANKTSHWAKLSRYVLTTLKGPAAIKNQITAFQPDVIHWHDYYHSSLAMFFVPFSGVKVLTNHAAGFLELYEKGGLFHQYLKFFTKRADIIIAPSQELADKSAILDKPVYFIPNGVDIEKFKPLTDKKMQRAPYANEDDFLLVAPRRLDPKNGLNYLIEALPKIKESIPHVKLIIAGGGPESLKQTYLDLAKALNVSDQLVITGNVPFAKMPILVACADIAVIPSLLEAVSLAALEAMACALPIVASNVGGLPFIIDDQVGRLVPPADPESLAKAIVELYQLPSNELHQMGQAAKARVQERFTWRQIAESALNVYQAH